MHPIWKIMESMYNSSLKDLKNSGFAVKSAAIKCPVCGIEDQGTFCSSCGNPLKRKRISISGLLESLLDFFSNLETKYASTFWSLVKRPSHFISRYIQGERESFYIPFKYFLLNLSINLFIYNRFNLDKISEDPENLENDLIFQLKSEAVFEQLINNFGSFFSLLIIPVFVLCAKLLYPRVKYNIAEMATAITFMLGQLMIAEVILNLVCAAIPSFYEVSRFLIMFIEIGIIFFLGNKLFLEKWYHAIWKSSIIFLTIFFTLKLVLISTQEILFLIYN